MLNLEGKYYSDPAIYAAELEKIFKRSWQLLGPESGMPDAGSYAADRKSVV